MLSHSHSLIHCLSTRAPLSFLPRLCKPLKRQDEEAPQRAYVDIRVILRRGQGLRGRAREDDGLQVRLWDCARPRGGDGLPLAQGGAAEDVREEGKFLGGVGCEGCGDGGGGLGGGGGRGLG